MPYDGHSPPRAGHARLSKQQQQAHDAIVAWLRSDGPQVFHLAGLAGTGKTELAVRLGIELGAQFAAYTGKAASVLRGRGADNAITLHSLLYGAPAITKNGEMVWQRRDGKIDADLIVADECGTVDKTLGRDLFKTGIRALVTGDPAQLPPVCGAPFFNKEPDFTLTEIHRQAANSQPLRLATAIREGEHPEPVPFDIDAAAEADIVICALNRTRRQLNKMVRRARRIGSGAPGSGDRLVALRNNHRTGVFNGSLWTITAIEPDDLLFHMTIVDDVGNEVETVAHSDGFFCSRLELQHSDYEHLDLFDHGFCLTAHKSQGSEWQKVVVVDETDTRGFRYIAGDVPLPEFRRRWMYTAVTRAKSRVTVMRAPR